MSIAKLNESTLLAAGLDRVTVQALRHVIRQTGDEVGATTLPQLLLSPYLKQPDAFVAPSLFNGWLNYGDPYNPVGYYKDAYGLVHLRGVVKSGSFFVPMFNLPVGFRPANEELLATSSRDDFGRVDITPAGDVVPKFGSPLYFSLDGLTFRAA